MARFASAILRMSDSMEREQQRFTAAPEAGSEEARGVAELFAAPPETQLEFLIRRALEENRLAAAARSPRAAAAHRYLSAAYAAEIVRERETAAALEALALQLS